MGKRSKYLSVNNNSHIPRHISDLFPILRLFVVKVSKKRDIHLQYIFEQPILFHGLLEILYNCFWGFFPFCKTDKRLLKRCKSIFVTSLNKQISLAKKKAFILSHKTDLRQCLKIILKYVD